MKMRNDRLIDLVEYSKDIRMEMLQQIMAETRPIYIYGAGVAAGLRIKWLNEYHISCAGCCVDVAFYEQNKKAYGLDVLCLDELLKTGERIAIVIGFENYERAQKIVCDLQSESVNVYYIEDPFKFRYMEYDFFLKHLFEFQKAYDLLEDELSHEIFVAHLNAKISGCSECISKYKSESPYGYEFDLLDLKEDEVFVDCGAFDGDTIDEFIKIVNGKYEGIYAFEPDYENAKKIENKKYSGKMKLIRKGAGEKEGMARFYVDGSLYSNFQNTEMWGKSTRRDLYEDVDSCIDVPITTIDNVMDGNRVTLIKMDIEGSELSALKGATNTISRYHPKLAICVYHKSEDLYAITNYIHSFDTDTYKYKYYIRQHAMDVTETVLYAIPEKKHGEQCQE